MGENSEAPSRRALLRAMVVGTAATTIAPTVLAAPVGAQVLGSDTCIPATVDWDRFAVGTRFTNTIVEGTNVSLSSTRLGSTTLLSDNLTVQNGPHGAINQRYLKLNQVPAQNSTNNGQTVRFTFSPAVTNLEVTLTDLDNSSSGWGDRVVMLEGGFASTAPPGSSVEGSGIVIFGFLYFPFENSANNTNHPDTSPGGNIVLRYTGPITTFGLRYYNAANTGGANQRIGISDITFLSNCATAARTGASQTSSSGYESLSAEELEAMGGRPNGVEPTLTGPIAGYRPRD